MHHVDSMEAIPLAKNSIVGGGHSAALRMTQVDRTRLKAGVLLDQAREISPLMPERRACPKESTSLEPVTWPTSGR